MIGKPESSGPTSTPARTESSRGIPPVSEEVLALNEAPAPYGKSTAETATASESLITFELPTTDKLPLSEQLTLLQKQGFQRLLVEGNVVRVEEALAAIKNERPMLTVVSDRVRVVPSSRRRFIEAVEQAYHYGQGKLTVWKIGGDRTGHGGIQRIAPFSAGFHCAECDLDYREPSAPLFSFNNPVGACPACKGFGRIITIDPDLALPDRGKTLAECVVRPWQSGTGAESQTDLMRMAKAMKIPTNVPFNKLSAEHQKFVVEGDPDYGKDEEHQWPRAWYGVKGYFRWLETKAYKMHVRVLLARYRSYKPCPTCGGQRFNPESLLFRLPLTLQRLTALGRHAAERGTNHGPVSFSLAEFYALPAETALSLISQLESELKPSRTDPLGLLLAEVRSRLSCLVQVGLGYLTLDRATRTLSGGETERVSLTTCLGTRLVNTLYILDEPSVGLHPRDTARLVEVLTQLRDLGNTVVVVEHESAIMRAADQILDIGPGHGESGGQVVFQGSPKSLSTAKKSLTADYLTGKKQIAIPKRRPVALAEGKSKGRNEPTGMLRLEHARIHNINDVSVSIPLERFVCVTGVSGSGKTSLIREVLLPALQNKLGGVEVGGDEEDSGDNEAGELNALGTDGATALHGWENLGAVVLVDQSPLGRTPRSNPAVYIGAFEDIRNFFARTDIAKELELAANAFSFNSAAGQCEKCRGAGFEKVEMQFLSDIYIRCAECQGARYRQHIRDIKVTPPGKTSPSWSVADLLDATVDQSIEFLHAFPDSAPAQSAARKLALLAEVGLGYLRVGQPINTLSGGESQRLKLVSHLATTAAANEPRSARSKVATAAATKPTLFLFDEPTTGLHFEDVRILLLVFQRLVDAGHTVLVIEHNLEVIKSADWVLDLGPEAGEHGGELVEAGTPETVAKCKRSHTGSYLREVLSESHT
ncbi:MAG TPA: excinuclease ABC subunit UvrA [Candidatus Limnocylindria bacterium]|nr:excinuclease ABC subunit UvrA [Candidatus Limnocylindria bacterium]